MFDSWFIVTNSTYSIQLCWCYVINFPCAAPNSWKKGQGPPAVIQSRAIGTQRSKCWNTHITDKTRWARMHSYTHLKSRLFAPSLFKIAVSMIWVHFTFWISCYLRFYFDFAIWRNLFFLTILCHEQTFLKLSSHLWTY